MDEAGYDHRAVEARIRTLWQSHDVYRFDRDGPGPVFSVDTPPPYVSAAHLHVGHAMSYAQPDFVVRYRRMRGERVFYPMGFDDNGLPTERYVERLHRVRAGDLPRSAFVALCLAETTRTARRYTELWRRLGLSVDWSLRYSTIDARCRRTAQAAFLRLYERGHVRRRADPILWCPRCRTALAQADIDDLERDGQRHDVAFSGPHGRPLAIATTRPELLPACVALYHHPDDDRYAGLAGATAREPLAGREVPILADREVDPGYGTGLVMVCTFGDGQDVLRWRRDGLATRLVVTEDGRLGEAAGEFQGLPLGEARRAVVARLRDTGALRGSTAVRQTVGVHERCGTPVELQLRRQWFVGVLAHRTALRRRAGQLAWVPEHMRRRLTDWIDGLRWDWNLSRQRRYGTPFPVWLCRACAAPVLADPGALPVDPLTQPPPVAACPRCGGELAGDPDVMDTWFTSSLTPEINWGWADGDGKADERRGRVGYGTARSTPEPMSLRVQGFEIIRTWLFYTLVQSELLFGSLPWRTVMISGHGLNERGRKISKRDLDESGGRPDRYLPERLIDRYGADALRLWATKARVGADLRFHEKDLRAGRRFAIKLWNVARFLTRHGGPPEAPPAELTAVDRWLLSHLADTLDEATGYLERYDPTGAFQAASRFFWSVYCDRYLEMIKPRFHQPEEHPEAERGSARTTGWRSFRAVLGLFAPFAPFVTEELYQRLYRSAEGAVSLHLTAWPAPEPGWRDGRAAAARSEIDQLVVVLDRVRALRAALRIGSGTRVAALVLHPGTEAATALAARVAEPLRAAARAERVIFGPAPHGSGVADLAIDVRP